MLIFYACVMLLLFLFLRVGGVFFVRLLGIVWEMLVHLLIVEPLHYWDHKQHRAKELKKPSDPAVHHLDWDGSDAPID